MPRVCSSSARAVLPAEPSYALLTRNLHPSHRSYPSLVKSIASILNCTAPVDGKRYLIGDLSVVCYEEWHIAFLAFAAIGAVVYALGIPLAVASVTAMRAPSHHDEEGRRQCRLCVRRKHATYATTNVRARYAFLFNGYATNRSGVIVAWEALVMIRKLAVALAGSMLADPYLQILVALLVLVVSCVVTAFVQPYETLWLNALDTLGLFALIVTQIVSIVYFYAETAQHPFMDSGTLEILTTCLLFALNATVLIAFALCAGSEIFGLRVRCAARRRVTLRVASAAARDAALRACAAGAAAEANCVWCHPSGIGVCCPPKMVGFGTWVWEHETLGLSASSSAPQLLLCIGGEETLARGDVFRTMHPTTRKLSPVETQPADVGGCGTKAQDATADTSPLAERDNPPTRWSANPLKGPPRGVEMVQRLEGGERAADGDAVRIVGAVPADAGANAAAFVDAKRSAPALEANAAQTAPPLKTATLTVVAPREGPERAEQGAVRTLAAQQPGVGNAVELINAVDDGVAADGDAVRIVGAVPADAGANAAAFVDAKRSAPALEANAAQTAPPLKTATLTVVAPREGPERAEQGAVRTLAAQQPGVGNAVELTDAVDDDVAADAPAAPSAASGILVVDDMDAMTAAKVRPISTRTRFDVALLAFGTDAAAAPSRATTVQAVDASKVLADAVSSDDCEISIDL